MAALNGLKSKTATFLLKPEVIIVLFDGSFQRKALGKSWQKVTWVKLRKTIDQLHNDAPHDVRLYFVSFQVEDNDKSELKRLIHKCAGIYWDISQRS